MIIDTITKEDKEINRLKYIIILGTLISILIISFSLFLSYELNILKFEEKIIINTEQHNYGDNKYNSLLDKNNLVLNDLKKNLLELNIQTFLVAFFTILFFIIIIGQIIFKLLKKDRNKIKSLNDYKHYIDEYFLAMSSTYIVTKADLNGTITFVNENFLKITGYKYDEIIDNPHSILKSPENENSIYKEMWSTISRNRIWKGMLKNRKKDGSTYLVNLSIYPICDFDGVVTEYISIGHEFKNDLYEYQLDESLKDRLTKLPNKAKLLIDLENNYKNLLAVFEITNYDFIKDFFGRDIANKLLLDISENITSLKNEKNFLYKFEEDKFAILSTEISKDKFVEHITSINSSLLDKVFTIEGRELNITSIVGISYEYNEVLLENAKLAVSYAKMYNKRVYEYSEEQGLEKNFLQYIDKNLLNVKRA